MIERGVNRECEYEVSIRGDPKALPYPSGGERQKTVRHKLSRHRDSGTYTSPGLGDSGERAAPSVLTADLQPRGPPLLWMGWQSTGLKRFASYLPS